uniref:Uncharacterized protein n=1 Tax=uncultured marine virus TaxID=186617 RepID=A0A0F7L0V8_9VIRU|nr:hypothetical protein [uncultured marine virus]
MKELNLTKRDRKTAQTKHRCRPRLSTPFRAKADPLTLGRAHAATTQALGALVFSDSAPTRAFPHAATPRIVRAIKLSHSLPAHKTVCSAARGMRQQVFLIRQDIPTDPTTSRVREIKILRRVNGCCNRCRRCNRCWSWCHNRRR